MTFKRFFGLFACLLVILMLGSSTVHAQQEGVVYAVLFYSPTCPHCHKVMQEDIPPLVEQYGDQLQILYVNVTMPEGREMLTEACLIGLIPDDRCGPVPNMIVGETVMIGSEEIPSMLPGLIEKGLSEGGIGLPAIPSLQAAFDAMRADADVEGEAESSILETETPTTTSWWDDFKEAPFDHSLAILVLLILLATVAMAFANLSTSLTTRQLAQWVRISGWALLGLAVISTLVAATLVLQGSEFSLATLLAMGVTIALLTVAAMIWDTEQKGTVAAMPKWLFPLVALIGLAVAGYLTYVEMGEHEAVCGAVGDCNLVQQSDYAELLGVSIGLLGAIGYVVILSLWFACQRLDGERAQQGHLLLLGALTLGVAFSIYLTFLEPFVIGAVCAWCLTSALLMALLLWMEMVEWISKQTPHRTKTFRQKTAAQTPGP